MLDPHRRHPRETVVGPTEPLEVYFTRRTIVS
jgi:hypothetical protein